MGRWRSFVLTRTHSVLFITLCVVFLLHYSSIVVVEFQATFGAGQLGERSRQVALGYNLLQQLRLDFNAKWSGKWTYENILSWNSGTKSGFRRISHRLLLLSCFTLLRRLPVKRTQYAWICKVEDASDSMASRNFR